MRDSMTDYRPSRPSVEAPGLPSSKSRRTTASRAGCHDPHDLLLLRAGSQGIHIPAARFYRFRTSDVRRKSRFVHHTNVDIQDFEANSRSTRLNASNNWSMPAPILATKLFIPPPRSKIVLRPRLVERLNEGLSAGRKLTLISSPAGFGKTTLVS